MLFTLLALAAGPPLSGASFTVPSSAAPPFTVEVRTAREGRGEGELLGWIGGRAAVMFPGTDRERILMTFGQKFRGTHRRGVPGYLVSDDRGVTWSELTKLPRYAPWPGPEGTRRSFASFVPHWHPGTARLLVTGVIVVLDADGRDTGRRTPAYVTYDPAADAWAPAVSVLEEFAGWFSGSSHGSFDGGSFLWPLGEKPGPAGARGPGHVARFRFDGRTLAHVKTGPPIAHAPADADAPAGAPDARPPARFQESDLTRFGGRYFLATRTGSGRRDRPRIAVSADGIAFAPSVPLRWDDGALVDSYATQVRWVTHSDGLFLAYTRANEGERASSGSGRRSSSPGSIRTASA